MGILNVLLAAGVSYIVLFGLKDREPPTVEILFPKDNYEFRTNKQIKVSAKDNKGIKVINYYIDDVLFHEENSENPISLFKIILFVSYQNHEKLKGTKIE